MALSPGMWDDLVPPEVWITLSTIGRREADHISLTVRVKENGRKSVSASAPVTRYAPTSSVVKAAYKTLEALQAAQVPLTAALLERELVHSVRAWVDPF
jgi:hypothetical protein